MGRWKSRGGKSQRRDEKRREEKRRREKVRQEKESEEIRCRCAKKEKFGNESVFPMISGSGGSKSRLAMRDEKLHTVVARSAFRSQKCYIRTDGLGALLEI